MGGAAVSGIHACTLIGGFMPEIMIMDLGIEDIDAADLIQLLMEQKRYAGMHIIVITDLPENDAAVVRIRGLREKGVTS